MAKDRALLRRGSRKMQDGTLGQKGDSESEEDGEMNIHIGDVITSQPESKAITASATDAMGSLAKQLAVGAALAVGAGGLAGGVIPWALGVFDKPEPAVQTMVDTDTDTQYELGVEVVN